MKKLKNILFYIVTIGIFSLLIYWIVIKGQLLEGVRMEDGTQVISKSGWEHFTESFGEYLGQPLAYLLLQIVSIIFVARIFGYLFKKIGQPTVIGEIIAGIILGPSILGWLFPGISIVLFPSHTLGNLQILSQIGLILFMFVIGMELDLKEIKNRAHVAIVISHASIIFPFTLGVALAYFLFPHFTPANNNFLTFGLFMGIAMSITAFPVLARIVQERKISQTKLGAMVITCAAADDITAWCLLAVIIAIVKAGSIVSALYTVLLAIIYILLMVKLVKPFLNRLGDIYSNRETLGKPIFAIFFIILLVSSYTTEIIGIHALFGAFMAGVIMPDNPRFRSLFIEKIETIALVLLLPLFFVFTGLRTDIGLLNDFNSWLVCALITLVAVAGKFMGGAFSARFVGQSWRDSLMIGSLMNTRGLMELIVLNIGYELGVLSPEIFSMMVIMAILTTFMTGPLMDLIDTALPDPGKLMPKIRTEGGYEKFNVLLSFGNPESGVTMLRIINGMVRKSADSTMITTLHLSPVNEMHLYDENELKDTSFSPITTEAGNLKLGITTVFRPSQNLSREIIQTANSGDFDFLMIGMGKSVFKDSLLGKIIGISTKIINPRALLDTIAGRSTLMDETVMDDKVRKIIRRVKIPVGVIAGEGLTKTDRIIIPVFSQNDAFLIDFALRLIRNSGSLVSIFEKNNTLSRKKGFLEKLKSIDQEWPGNIIVLPQKDAALVNFEDYDLMLINFRTYRNQEDNYNLFLNAPIPKLIINP